MKKTSLLVLTFCLLLALVLCGCNGSAPPADNPPAANPDATPDASTPDPAPEEKGTVTLVSWGGTVEEAFIDLGMADVFYEDTGYKLELIPKSDSATIIATALAQADNPEVDVVFCDNTSFLAGVSEGIFGNLADYDLPALADLPDNFKFDTYTYEYVDYPGIIYDKAVYDANGWDYPTGWKDLGANIAGKFTIDNYPGTYTEAIIMGFADNDPTKYKQAFERIKTDIAPYLFEVSDTKSQVAEWFKSGNIVAAAYAFGSYAGFEHTYELTTLTFCFPEEGVYVSPASIGIMKNSKNPEGAAALMNWMLSEKWQSFRCERFGQMPVNLKVELSGKPGTEISAEIISSARNFDFDYIQANREEWLELWNDSVLSVERAY